ncbi:unnamed protein product [Arctogadus glacialis]
MDYGSTPIRQTPTGGGEAAKVHSISDGGGLYRNMDRLTEDMREIRVEMRRMAEENKKLKSSGWGDEGRLPQCVEARASVCVVNKAASRVAHGVTTGGAHPTVAGVNEKRKEVPAENRITRRPLVTEPPLQLGGTLDLPEAPSRMIHREGEGFSLAQEGGSCQPFGERDVADVAAQTSATALWGPFEREMLPSAADACDLTLDPNTAYRLLSLSEDNRKVTVVEEVQSYPDHPDRFDSWPQVLDRPAGSLSFYRVSPGGGGSSDTLTHLHTFWSSFTQEDLLPGVGVP